MKNSLLVAAAVLAALVAIPAVVVWSGAVDVAADTPHGTAVFKLLETVRDRSIAVRARGIEIPGLSDPEAVRRGAGNYDSMCTECHLAPGASETELSRGLYPSPPNLSRVEPTDPARAYWIIKHGVKATGMPAWGKSMEDRHIWDMVALLKVLPQMSEEQYLLEVGLSGGHSHGEMNPETDQEDTSASGHEHSSHGQSDAEETTMTEKPVHTHKDGAQHEH